MLQNKKKKCVTDRPTDRHRVVESRACDLKTNLALLLDSSKKRIVGKCDSRRVKGETQLEKENKHDPRVLKRKKRCPRKTTLPYRSQILFCTLDLNNDTYRLKSAIESENAPMSLSQLNGQIAHIF